MIAVSRTVRLTERPRGCHLITREVLTGVPELAGVAVGVLHVFILHTSASLAVQENADPTVRHDLAMALDHVAPENLPYRHADEGPDDMPAHVKAALVGSSVSVPVRDGRPVLGTWQGIYLCEHRDRGGARSLQLTLLGAPAA